MPIVTRRDLITPGILIGMTDENAPDKCAKIREAVAETKPEQRERKQGLIKLAIDQGCLDVIPDDWEVEVEDDGSNDTSA